ncbi:FMN-binding negative transcriptional regulator [Microtetraspora fusca]|uniref:FMN-binding negative transcriptional regulator n=1 Tax=Microtetraspora fusca TaxID=1997 RepID=A0ABW6VFM5_MICFU|nr:FMN-binding negative transcriptional regulator [Microtetraspora fusca]
MLIHPWDSGTDDEALAFVQAHEFGQLVAAGRDRDIPVIVPTQFVLADEKTLLLHLARPNPIWTAIEENPSVVMSLAGDWAYVPAAWKAIDGEDPARGVPTTYYAAVQLICTAQIVDDPKQKAVVLRRQLARLEPDAELVDPLEHGRILRGIRGLRLSVREVNAKFKYGGNVDDAHRGQVAKLLAERDGPGDTAALGHLRRRTPLEAEPVGTSDH